MSSETARWVSVSRLLGQEAYYLDSKNWDAWLDLYTEDAVYWAPSWDDDGNPTSDPQREISLIYYPDRKGLEDRVFRIRTGRSASASNPPPRTSHVMQLLQVEVAGERVHARANWVVNTSKEGETTTYFGWADYELVPNGDSWRIARRVTYILNDSAKTVIDVNMI